jgi:ATP-dependent protease HslVU (ClpYQ) peptidase subunit
VSVVVAKVYPEEIRIAADSQVTTGWTKESVPFSKIFRHGDSVIGSVGYAEEIALFRVFLQTNHLKEPSEEAMIDHLAAFQAWASKRIDKQYKLDNNYLYIYQGVPFHVHGFYVKEIDDYSAIGSGKEFAFGAISVGATVRQAVEAACKHNIYCQLPINEFSVIWNDGRMEIRDIA